MRGFFARFTSVGIAALLVGCGGGGGSSLPAAKTPVTAPSSAPSGSSSATLSISVHPQVNASSRARHVLYVVPTVQSITVQAVRVNGVAVSGQTVYEQDLASSSSGCAATGATVTCSAHLTAPNGTVLFAIKSYNAPGGTGSPVATSYAVATIAPSGANRVTLSAGATIAQVQLYLATPNFAPGTAGTSLLVAVPLDTSGNVIVAAGPYDQPIALSLAAFGPSGTSVTSSLHLGFLENGASTASATASLTSPNDQVLVNYDGSTSVNSGVITASVAESPVVTATATVTVSQQPFTSTLSSGFIQNAGLAFTTTGQTGTINVSGGTPPYSTSVLGSAVTASINSTTGADSISAVAYGTATVVVTDSASNSISFPVSVAAAPVAITYAVCGTSATCGSSSVQFPQGTGGAYFVSLTFAGGDGSNYVTTFGSTGTSTSTCDSISGSGASITVQSTGACSDLLVVTSGGQTAYLPLLLVPGDASVYTIASTSHAYSPATDAFTTINNGQFTLALAPGNGNWSDTTTCGLGTTHISTNTLTFTAPATGTSTCTVTLIPGTPGAASTVISISVIPALSASTQALAFHGPGELQSVTISNASSGGLSTSAPNSVLLVSGSSVANLAVTGNTVAITSSASTGPALVQVRDTNLDEKIGISISADTAWSSQVPQAIMILPGSALSNAYVGSLPPGAFLAVSATTPLTVNGFSPSVGTYTVTSAGCGGGSNLFYTDIYGASEEIPVIFWTFTYQYPGSAIGSTADIAFPATGLTDLVQGACGGGSFSSATSANPNIVTATAPASGGLFSITAVNPGVTTVSVCDATYPTACANLKVSVTTTTIPILSRGRRTP